MTRQAWLTHMESLFGSPLPRNEETKTHPKTCSLCAARRRTQRSNRNARERSAALRSLGLKRTPYGWE